MTDDDLTAADGAAESDLHGAAWHGELSEVKELVESGCDVNWKDSIGETALFGAAASGHLKVVEYLLSVGAETNLQEKHSGYTPLHWAARSDLAIVKCLVDAGANVYAEDGFGNLPIDVAHQYGYGENVAFLKTVGPQIASRPS